MNDKPPLNISGGAMVIKSSDDPFPLVVYAGKIPVFWVRREPLGIEVNPDADVTDVARRTAALIGMLIFQYSQGMDQLICPVKFNMDSKLVG